MLYLWIAFVVGIMLYAWWLTRVMFPRSRMTRPSKHYHPTRDKFDDCH